MVRSHFFRKNTTFLKLDFSKPWYCTAVLWKKCSLMTSWSECCSTKLHPAWNNISPYSFQHNDFTRSLSFSRFSYEENGDVHSLLLLLFFPRKILPSKALSCEYYTGQIFPLRSLKMLTAKHWIYYTLKNLASITVIPTLLWNVWLSSILK